MSHRKIHPTTALALVVPLVMIAAGFVIAALQGCEHPHRKQRSCRVTISVPAKDMATCISAAGGPTHTEDDVEDYMSQVVDECRRALQRDVRGFTLDGWCTPCSEARLDRELALCGIVEYDKRARQVEVAK